MQTVQQAIDYIHAQAHFGEKVGLRNMQRLLHRLGNPQQSLRCIHVAGTNGKGSVCAFLDSALRASKYRVGLYTSPYLQRFQERIRIDGVEIDDARLLRWANRVREQVDQMREQNEGAPTFFEIVTAIAFGAFSEAGVDIAVIEVGLGGRLDPTNVIDPMLSVITPIGMDHMHVLGDTMEQIATEKAGIIKPGRPVVVAPQTESVKQVLAQAAKENQSDFFKVSDATIRIMENTLQGQRFDIFDGKRELPNLFIPLLGAHQVENAATALTVLLVLRELGWNLPDAALRKGFAQARWPGRFEWFPEKRMLLDGAYNAMGAAALTSALQTYFPNKRLLLVTALMADKDRNAILDQFSLFSDRAICTRVANERCSPPEQIAEALEKRHVPCTIVPSMEDALAMAEHSSADAIIVSGSLYLVGAARSWIEARCAP